MFSYNEPNLIETLLCFCLFVCFDFLFCFVLFWFDFLKKISGRNILQKIGILAAILTSESVQSFSEKFLLAVVVSKGGH